MNEYVIYWGCFSFSNGIRPKTSSRKRDPWWSDPSLASSLQNHHHHRVTAGKQTSWSRHQIIYGFTQIDVLYADTFVHSKQL